MRTFCAQLIGSGDFAAFKRRARLSVGAFLLSIAACALLHAQSVAPPITNVYAVGVSANPGQSPSVSGTAMYAHAVTGAGTYAGAIVDILPQTIKPIVVNTNIGAFAAQKVVTVAGVDVFTTGSTGVSLNGSNTGWSWSGGGAAVFKLPKPNWYVLANVRVSKSSVSGGTGYQLIPGVQFAWGN